MRIPRSACISMLYKGTYTSKMALKGTELATVNDIRMRRQQFQSKLILLHLRKDCITFLLQEEIEQQQMTTLERQVSIN